MTPAISAHQLKALNVKGWPFATKPVPLMVSGGGGVPRQACAGHMAEVD